MDFLVLCLFILFVVSKYMASKLHKLKIIVEDSRLFVYEFEINLSSQNLKKDLIDAMIDKVFCLL